MKILDLVVRYKWYDMEDPGDKPEEQDVTPTHWMPIPSLPDTNNYM